MMAAESSPPAASVSAAADDLETLALDSANSSPSTDPLLRPPSSSSNGAASHNHEPFVIDDFLDSDDDDGVPAPAPPPSARAPAARAGEAAPVFARITVSDPKKHAEPVAGAAGVIPGSGSYFSYLVTARLLADGGGGGAEFRVRRRFRDVVALADRLAAAHRGLFVPARPDKSLVEGQVMQRHDFVSQRCTALQRYLRRLAAHPVVGGSPDLRTFLTEPGAIPDFHGEAPRYWTTTVNAAIQQVPAKAGRDLFGMFKDLKQTVVNGLVATKPPPVEEETDAEFLAHKSRLQDLQQQLTTTSQQVHFTVICFLL
jgi:sorting nexin-1/2